MKFPSGTVRSGVAVAAACIAFISAVGTGAQINIASEGIGTRVGAIDLTADSSTVGVDEGYIIYKGAKMKSADGTTLQADEIRANLSKNGNGIVNVVLTGHVRAYLEQIDLGRTYTVTTDKAVYDPKANNIALTGGVTVIVTSPYTVGPFTQTGDTGMIQLGPSPDYPTIVTYNIHTTFTPQQ